MSNWLTRPGYIAVMAFLAGAAIAGVIVLIVWLVASGGGDGSDGTETPGAATSTPAATRDLTAEPAGTPTPNATEEPSTFDSADEALTAYIRRELDSEYGGPCSSGVAPGDYCSSDLDRGADLVTVLLGLANSEFHLEAVITRLEDGTWAIDVFGLPDPDATLSIGATAVVNRAGTCLNFRAAPGLASASVTCQLDGTRGRIDDGPVTTDDIVWWHLEGYGWASEEFLGVAGG